jgi:hypothetical protein
MRSRLEAKLAGRGTPRKTGVPAGGKVLQRLFAYLGQRNPKLGDEVVARLAVPTAERPAFGLTRKALRAKVARVRRAGVTAKPFAAAIVKAATALGRSRQRAETTAPKAKGAAAISPLAPAPWRPIGPSVIPNGQTYGSNTVDVIGRVASIAVDPGNPSHLLLGAAGGGIWESKNTGAAWAPCTDHMPSLAIGAIAFDPKTPSKVYAGSGEGNFYANLGAGVYKSTNGGTTWAVVASAPFVGVGFYDLVVDPANPTVLYAATTSGFYKSTNSGASWSLKRPGACWDISVHANGGSVEVLATFASGLFVSTNGGNTFAAVTLPSGPAGSWTRLAVDRVKTTPDIAYVFGAAGSSAYLWRRTGTTWKKIALPTLDIGQAWYDWYVAATPNNPNRVYVGAIDTFRGIFSGHQWTWTNITTQGGNSIHPDQHCMAFAPNNSQVIYAGNDGGIYRSANSGATWTALNKGLGITEIEYLATGPNTWKWLMAGTQDNGTIRFTGPTVWNQIAQGDGGDCGVNQLNPLVVYHSYYDVSLERSSNKGNTWTRLAPPKVPSLFYPPVEVFGSTVAIGAASLVVTRTGAPPWTSVGLGLAAGELSTAMRDIDANTILIGTNQGRMMRVRWSGTSWTRVQLASPAGRYISCIAVDPSNPQRIWVTFSQLGGGLVYRSDSGGGSWVNCTAGLPGIPMNSVVVDPANFKRVWVAADVGVYQTLNLGSSWAGFSTGLPNAIAADLILHKQDRMLICATRNRGAWVTQVP